MFRNDEWIPYIYRTCSPTALRPILWLHYKSVYALIRIIRDRHAWDERADRWNENTQPTAHSSYGERDWELYSWRRSNACKFEGSGSLWLSSSKGHIGCRFWCQCNKKSCACRFRVLVDYTAEVLHQVHAWLCSGRTPLGPERDEVDSQPLPLRWLSFPTLLCGDGCNMIDSFSLLFEVFQSLNRGWFQPCFVVNFWIWIILTLNYNL